MATPSDEPQLSPDEASRLDALYAKLSANIDVMRVLYVLKQGGWSPYLLDVTTQEARRKAIELGLVNRFRIVPSILFLNDNGRLAINGWMAEMDNVLRNDRFQNLFRHVIAW